MVCLPLTVALAHSLTMGSRPGKHAVYNERDVDRPEAGGGVKGCVAGFLEVIGILLAPACG